MIGSGRMRDFRRFQILKCWPSALPLDEDDLDGTALGLLNLVALHNGKLASKWPVAPQIVRGAAVELAAAQSAAGQPLGDRVIELLTWAASLPASFVDSPTDFFEGKTTGGRPGNSPYAYDLAQMCDWHQKRRGLPEFPLSRLEKSLRDVLGTAPSRATLRAWREEASYQNAVNAQRDAEDLAIERLIFGPEKSD